MKAGLEFEGKTVEQAVDRACEQLNVAPKEIKYDIISSGSTGIFGLVGVKKAKIRVTAPLATDAPADKAASDGRPNLDVDADTNGVVQSLVDEAFNGTGGKKENRRPRPARKPVGGDQPPKAPVTEKPPIEDLLNNENVQQGKEALKRIVEAITSDTEVALEQDRERVVFKITGGNPSVLIGKRGQNLEAIQYLIDKIVNKTNERRIRIQVDAAGYLEKRKENLVRLAEKMAQKARRTGKPSTVGPMNAQDRRVIHITLKNSRGVRTQSVGDGYYRKLMILPKRSTPNRRKKTAEKAVSSDNRA